ncbi:hypothetical protein N657DRAFT_641762 [Parathielavia appendiculata]|uniref:Prokaryotic-type class I peptide chain release factors domain-containing protein n=1 Tax=Parathielavia appendiculata TaxID=2587402 RepID=A0AAN6U781_9PEZI|nr:hypothetical protein N657DRAFT_641762 [Parathielavia appendiculata]
MLRPLSCLHLLFRPAGFCRPRYGFPNPWLRSGFTTSTATNFKQMPPRPKHPPESEIEESFLKGSGPGGQKINKTNSAVQLRHIPTGIVVKSQATRSRTQNRKIARDLLALKLDELANGPQSRAAIVSDVKKKRADSRAKKARRKYRKLAEEAGTGVGNRVGEIRAKTATQGRADEVEEEGRDEAEEEGEGVETDRHGKEAVSEKEKGDKPTR